MRCKVEGLGRFSRTPVRFYGLYLGEGRVVYASMRAEDRRFPYLCQVAVGVPALPAPGTGVSRESRQGADSVSGLGPLHGSPRPGKHGDGPSELDDLQKRLNRFFELGTVYTMVAGLLNVLAIYDAWGGPPNRISRPKKKRTKRKMCRRRRGRRRQRQRQWAARKTASSGGRKIIVNALFFSAVRRFWQ